MKREEEKIHSPRYGKETEKPPVGRLHGKLQKEQVRKENGTRSSP